MHTTTNWIQEVAAREHAHDTSACRVCRGPRVCRFGLCSDCTASPRGAVKLSALCNGELHVIDRVGEYELLESTRDVISMYHHRPLQHGESGIILARPQRFAVRPERIFISNSGTLNGAQDWLVNSIRIGRREQLTQGPVPGDMFAISAVESFISFETCQTAMDLEMTVTYQGSNPNGAPFFASIACGDAGVLVRRHLVLRIDGMLIDFITTSSGSCHAVPTWPDQLPDFVDDHEGARVPFGVAAVGPILATFRMQDDVLWAVSEHGQGTILEVGHRDIVTRRRRRLLDGEDLVADIYGDWWPAPEVEGPPEPITERHREIICKWEPAGYVADWEDLPVPDESEDVEPLAAHG